MDFAVASVAGALGLDVEIATTSGRNVAENNAFSLFRSDSEEVAEQEDPEEEKQDRGRSKEKRHFAERDESPERLTDTHYEEITNSITQEMASWKPSAEQCLNGDVGVKNFARSLGYLQLERINMLNQRLDVMTGGGWSTLLGSVDDGADIARTYTRRTVRFLINDQRLAQNVGDYTYLALSALGGKGLKALGVAPTLASRASQLNKAALINKAAQKSTTASNGNTPVRTVAEQKQMLEGLDLADSVKKQPYNPWQMRADFEAVYGKKGVGSTTLPALNARGSKFAGQRHPKSEIVYDTRANPIFENPKHLFYDTIIGPENFVGKGRSTHMRAATRQLREDIDAGRISKSPFSDAELKNIQKGKSQIGPDKTWHHDPQPGRMKLVDTEKHRKTPHIGSISLQKTKE